MTSKSKSQGMRSEDEDHRAMVRIMRAAGIFFEHVPMGGERNQGSGRQMRELGAVKGSADFRIYDRPPKAPFMAGAAFELKREDYGSGLSEDQASFLTALKERGWLVAWGNRADMLHFLREICGYDV